MIVVHEGISKRFAHLQLPLLLLVLCLLPLGVANSQGVDVAKRTDGDALHRDPAKSDLPMHDRIHHHLSEQGFSEEQIEKIFGAMKKLIPAIQKGGEAFELDERMQEYLFDEVGLDDEQVDLVIGLSQRVARARGQERREKTAAHLERLRSVFKEHHFSAEQIEKVVAFVQRILPKFQAQGKGFAPSPEMAERFDNYMFDEVGLDEEQVELVEGVIERLLRVTQRREPAIPYDRIERVLREQDFSDEQVEGVFELLKKLVPQFQKEPPSAETVERIQSYLGDELGLDDDQIERVEIILKRLARQVEKGEQKPTDKIDLDQVWKKLEAAIDAGEMTVEEAEAKMIELLRKKRDARDPRAQYRLMEQRIRAALDAGKLTEEEAERKRMELRRRLQGDKPERPRGGQF